jgi:hypothetical protein
MCVLVKDADESILSPAVEVVESAGIGDRLRSWAHSCCSVQGPAGSMLVEDGVDRLSSFMDQAAESITSADQCVRVRVPLIGPVGRGRIGW